MSANTLPGATTDAIVARGLAQVPHTQVPCTPLGGFSPPRSGAPAISEDRPTWLERTAA